jgi:hypothetical protein
VPAFSDTASHAEQHSVVATRDRSLTLNPSIDDETESEQTQPIESDRGKADEFEPTEIFRTVDLK